MALLAVNLGGGVVGRIEQMALKKEGKGFGVF